ncbi:MAG: ABC transporter permease [Verrucomicrobium sp.]|nr:ABC transporter permease [Verrucomicrobium sp.]
MSAPGYARPGFLTQAWLVFRRRVLLFFREPGECWLQLALLVGFPGLVALFAYDGLPQIRNLSMDTGGNLLRQLAEAVGFTSQAGKVGGLVSGLVMFQVVLLTLTASNNGAREIAAERLLYEKERLAGLRPESYLAAKAAFLLILVTAQAGWMTLFVKLVCQFPGDLAPQFASLFLVDAAMTAVSLAISAWAGSAEQASLISVYLVGFQLPLSGAVLALPEPLGALVRPFIASYWSWSGYLQTMRDTRFYDMVRTVTSTPVAGAELCQWMLLGHIVVGLVFAYLGCLRSRWE